MKSKILIYGSVTLRKSSEEVSSGQPELINSLFDTLNAEEGIGLAAPQIGVLKRVFIINTEGLLSDDSKVEKIKRAYINPEIFEVSLKTLLYKEGCLSIPNIFQEVERPKSVRVRYFDEDMKEVIRQLDGIEARVFQHEYDHLEGILFVDRISPIRRAIIANKLKGIQKLSKTYKT